MNFALDLLDSVSQEAPEAVLRIVQNCAERGEHLVVSRWISQQTSNLDSAGQSSKPGHELSVALGAEDGPFINAMLTMASRSDGKTGDPAAAAFGQWAGAALASQPGRFSELLNWCVHSTNPPLDAAGRELLRLGADALDASLPDEYEAITALSGVKAAMTESRVTLLAYALSHQHPLAGELVERSSSAKTPWPVVAEVGLDGDTGVMFPVNAAGYAIALGDVKMLREVCKNVRGDEHQMGIGLADAVDFALSSGLTVNCTPEMAHCVAVCIASGADLDHAKIGARLITQRVTLAQEVSDFAYREISQEQTDPSYSIACLFMSARTGAQSLLAISKLSNSYELELNGPVTQSGSRASLLHYAAACGHGGLVEGLVKLGADVNARDSKGLTPALWAQVFDRQEALQALDPLNALSAKQTIAPALAVDDASMPTWKDDGQSWTDQEIGRGNNDIEGNGRYLENDVDQGPSMTLEEFSAIHGDGEPLPIQKAKVPEIPVTAKIDRNSIAPSVTSAQASKGAALFSRLKSSQETIAAKASAKDEAREVINKAEQAERLASGPRVTFRGR